MFSVAKGGENTLQISANACGIPHAHLSQKNSHTQPRRRQAGTAPPAYLESAPESFHATRPFDMVHHFIDGDHDFRDAHPQP